MIVETHGLTKKYGSTDVVSLLNLAVEERSIYGFLGPNGAGKTTTIRMLLGLITPSEGEILLFGRSLHTDKRQILHQIGSLVESPSLYEHLTARENLRVATTLLQLPPERIEYALHIVDLTRDAKRRVSEFSQGMKQRLGIALALLHQPKLLILDEPLNGLDPQGIREMRTFLHALPEQSDVTVFLSSHLLNEVELIATHIGILNQGKLLFQNTLEALQGETKNLVSFKVDNQEKARELLLQRLVSGAASEQDSHMVVVHVRSEQEISEMTKRLVEEGIAVYAVAPQTLHLEDLFFKYAGRKEA